MKYKYVNELMTKPAITIEENTSIKEAIKIMEKENIGFLPITKNNIVIGVITDRDILIRSIGKYDINSKISNIMTQGEIFFVSPSDSIIDAAKIMATNKIRRLVVLSDGKPTGILTTKNLLKENNTFHYILQTYSNNDTLKEYSLYANSNPHDSIKTSDYPL